MYTPLEITQKTEELWIIKWTNSFRRTLVLWILGWMFVAMWAAFSINTITWMAWVLPYWMMKLFWGLTFCLWLILVILGWWELFTWNVLLVIAWLQKRIKTSQFLKNLAAVWVWNFIGSFIIVSLLFIWWFHLLSDNSVWLTILKVAGHKVELSFIQAIALWILCNVYVCFAIWICYSWKTTTDKILASIFPIAWFAAIGFEHIVANMFYLPYWFLINTFTTISEKHYELLTIKNIILTNAIPVTIWNLIWWTLFCWVIYWLLFLKFKKQD